MKIVYTSRTGNVQSVIERLGITGAIRIGEGTDKVSEDYILITYTDGYGEVPLEVEEFLKNNSEYLRGVIASGNTGYGEAFCAAGNVISEQYNVPFLYKFEDEGTDEDIEKIKVIIKKEENI